MKFSTVGFFLQWALQHSTLAILNYERQTMHKYTPQYMIVLADNYGKFGRLNNIRSTLKDQFSKDIIFWFTWTVTEKNKKPCLYKIPSKFQYRKLDLGCVFVA